MDPWLIVAIVLMSVLVGATLPVLFQLHATLRETRRLLSRLGPKLDATLADVQEVTRGARSTMPELAKSAREVNGLLVEATAMTHSLRQLRRSIKIAAAVGGALGPAVAAAVQAFVEQQAQGAGRASADAARTEEGPGGVRNEPVAEKGESE